MLTRATHNKNHIAHNYFRSSASIKAGRLALSASSVFSKSETFSFLTMSDTRATKSGLAAEAQRKLEASYSKEAEAQVRAWLEEVVGEEIGPDFFADMKDGTYLCK